MFWFLLVVAVSALEDNFDVFNDGHWLARGEPLDKLVTVTNLNTDANTTFTRGTEVVGFGYSVVIDQEWMAISAPWVSDNSGTTFTYRHNGTHWNFFRELPPLTNQKGSFYGKKQVLKHGWLMVSHEGADVELFDKSGSVYLYHFTGIDWALRTIIHPFTPEEDSYFGSCLDFDGHKLVVGSRGRGNAGSIYIFEYNETTSFYEERHELAYPVEFHNGAEFGYDCAIQDELVVAGAYKGSENQGDVNFFRLEGDTWVHRQTIEPIPQITISGAKFGSTLDLKRTEGTNYTLLLVGAPHARDLNDYVNGAASIYNYNNFTSDPCFTHQETFFSDGESGINRGMGIKVQLVNNTEAMVLEDRVDKLHFFGSIDGYTMKPTSAPSVSPTVSPTESPSVSPTMSPTLSPSRAPTETGETPRPTLAPIESTPFPTRAPTGSPTTTTPTGSPTSSTVEQPTVTTTAITVGIVVGSALALCIAWGFLASRRRRRNRMDDS